MWKIKPCPQGAYSLGDSGEKQKRSVHGIPCEMVGSEVRGLFDHWDGCVISYSSIRGSLSGGYIIISLLKKQKKAIAKEENKYVHVWEAITAKDIGRPLRPKGD